VHNLQPTSRPPKSLPSSNKQSPRRCVQCSEVTCLYLDVGSTTAEPLSNVGLYVKWVPTDAPKDVEKVQAVVRCFMSLPPACWKHFTRFCSHQDHIKCRLSFENCVFHPCSLLPFSTSAFSVNPERYR